MNKRALPAREELLNLLNLAMTRREFEHAKMLIDLMLKEAKEE